MFSNYIRVSTKPQTVSSYEFLAEITGNMQSMIFSPMSEISALALVSLSN